MRKPNLTPLISHTSGPRGVNRFLDFIAHRCPAAADLCRSALKALDPRRRLVKTLAEAVVWLMELLTGADEPGIDYQACGDITNDLWFELAKSSPAERQALAEAAAARLRELSGGPDAHVYTRGGLIVSLQRDLLQGLADGSAWYEFDRPEAADAVPGAAADGGGT